MSDYSALVRLPTEILGMIITLTSQTDLSALSLVSHSFQRLAFPLKHYTIVLRKTPRIEQLILLIESKSEDAVLGIGQVLRCLTLDTEICELDGKLIPRFREIIPKLTGIEHLAWKVRGYPECMEFFEDFRRWCPRLNSVDLNARDISDPYTQSECSAIWPAQ